MPEIRFALKRGEKPPNVNRNDSEASRNRFLLGIEELRNITSKVLFDEAIAGGVETSISGFMKRNGIGSTSMRTTNNDLFDLLCDLLDDLNGDYGNGKNKKGENLSRRGKRPGRPQGKKKADDVARLEARVAELEALLESRSADSIQFLEQLQALHRDVSSRR
jgi:hypothetical protein